MKRRSFSRRLTNSVTFFVALVFIGELVVVELRSTQLIAEEASVSTQHMLHGTIGEMELPLREVEITTGTVATLMATMDGGTARAEVIVRRMVERDSLICGGSVIFPKTDGACATMSYEDSSGEVHSFAPRGGWDAESWVMRCLALVEQRRGPVWASPYMAEGDREVRVAAYCHPVYLAGEGDSTLIAVVTAELPVDWMERKCESLRPYPNAVTAIVCDDRTLMGIRDSAILNRIETSVADERELKEVQEDIRRGGDSMRRIGKGAAVGYVTYGPLHNGWAMLISCQYKDVLRRSSQMHANLLVIAVVVMLLLYLACRIVIKRMASPITQLSDAALRMAKGDLQTQLPEGGGSDEMQHLHDSFVYMQNSIADYIEELRRTTAAKGRMESELAVARNIQMGMLRRDFPQNVAALLVPAKEVGGDLYDFVQREGYLYFSIGDVSGKGVPASLMMAITRAGLRFVAGMKGSMDGLMERVNVSVTESNANNMFVTLFMGRINLTTRKMDFCNAGHNPIVVVPPEGDAYFLKAKPNLAIGLFDDFRYEAESMTLAAGTRLILYTDGVNEAERADKSLFGNERLLEWAKSDGVRDAKSEDEVVESLYAAVQRFTDGNVQNDDITIMSVRID